ncbi:uncharacterized protein LOC114388620 isoform X5 [Glycine soja]|uniref:uncharacterized protein isoform X6 n=1 Tax=Glycine max TaxID=3847 RepID=UPI0007190A2A|nr:uncharacterized protein LOC100780338 isoform X6 [Glycine max]XP_028205003.1 uncharacterized protein LOC114388620 isoform X5 [Glycine soja]|eukprot:XP_014623690.1 uncharacterized protein LOC100780338 isoform X6 [Glycine max]
MPGSIMVSVLEFIDLPLSSSTSIRASLGKIEYQVNDKGNLSFPLTSLRDDLIFKIQDAEGNEISRTGVQIKLILEKGVLEDNFPLGGGHLRLKLQFILSDEERDRIRSLRQSALKKKHELLSSGRRAEESDSRTMIGDAALPFRRNDEVSESPKKQPQQEAQLQDPAGSGDGKESDTRNVVGAQLDQKKQLIKPNQYRESSSTIPVSQAVTLTRSPQKEKKEALTSNLIQPNLEQGGIQYSEKRTSLGRIPSNVKKMISAFEGGLAQQDKRPQIKPPPTKQQESSIERRDSSKTQLLEQDKSKNTEPADLHERVKRASLNEANAGTGTEEGEYEKIRETKESKPKTSDNNGDENSGGPFNQVVKVAIIIGFGLLVLLTRQRKRSNGEGQKDVFNFLNLPE